MPETTIKNKIYKLLPKIEKPARYAGGELNSVIKPKDEIECRIALAFPDTYDVGMSNLGLKILYSVINNQTGLAAERVFCPDIDMHKLMRESSIPLYTLETFTPLSECNILAFSIAYEMCYTTVLEMMDMSNIPIKSCMRTDKHPIVIAGGHCATNPEPMVDFIDAFVIGDGEDVILEIANVVRNNKDSRETAISKLAEIEGVYVPAVHRDKENIRIEGRRVASLENALFPDSMIVPFTETVHDRVALEIMRGCTRGCRFCQAGMITRPVRERSLSELIKQADKLLSSTGHEEISLVSLSSADYSQIDTLVKTLTDRYEKDRVGISLPSLRADAKCVNLAADIQRVRKSGLTFAPEAGTQKLRDVINKNVSERDLLDAVAAAVKQGWQRLKLYFMIGLPTETEEDILGIADLVRKVISVGIENGKFITLNVTISPFVPKPHTPFQWRGMTNTEELEQKIALLRPKLKGKNILLSWHDPYPTKIEALLARGSSELGKVIEKVWQEGGMLEQDHFKRERWENACREIGVDIDKEVTKTIPYDEKLPWDHISVGVSKDFLIREDKNAELGIITEDCREGCCGCGINIVTKDICPPNPTKLDFEQYKIEEKIRSNEPVKQIMLTFEKNDLARWLGHLDILRIFEKAVRISRIPVMYSEGYNPRIKMSIMSALPLGVTGSSEYLSLTLTDDVDNFDLIRRLNKSLPAGLRILEAREITLGRKPNVPIASEFEVYLDDDRENDIELLQSSIFNLLEKDTIIIERISKGKKKQIDIRKGIKNISIYEEDKNTIIRLMLLHKDFTVKPMEVIDILKKSYPELVVKKINRRRMTVDLESEKNIL
ncbi:MAG: TIGR03960 family B12-binding radical SAM protein [Armatimonadota bacterium]